MKHTGRQTRRWITGGLGLALLMLLLLAACGTNAADTTANTNAEAAAPRDQNGETEGQAANAASDPKEAEPPQTRSFTDDLGRQVDIPVNPQRIVAGEFASELLAVGVKPVGSGANGFKVVFTQSEMAGVAPIGDPPDPEKILDLAPDLILASTVFQDIYPEQMEQLSRIAPVVYLSYDQDPIYDLFPKVADLVGKSEEAKAWLAGYEADKQTAQDAVRTAVGDDTVSVFRIEKGRLRIYLNRNFAGYMLYSGLEVKPPSAVAAEIAKTPYGSAVEISLEKLPEYAGDRMFVIVRGGGEDREAYEQISNSALWKALPAVKSGKVYYIDTDKYYGSDVATIRGTMSEAAAMLAAGTP